ncbi:MAG: WecB/TagA/CpsF family glycosyltransferase [Chloroflexales bacterium]
MTNPLPDQPARFPVLDVGVSAISLPRALAMIDGWIARGERRSMHLCTTHTVLECHRAPELAAIMNAAGIAAPDGMPLVWLGRMRGHSVDRVYGPDVMLATCDRGQASGQRHYFYGGAPGVAERLAERMRSRFPQLQVAGTYTPPFRPLTAAEEQAVAAQINASGPDIVWVGLGTPKQDYWVARFRPLLNAPVLIAVGAAFDFHTGRVRQAPRWMQRSGLEWLFRLSQDPRRLWRRYLLGNPTFLVLIARQWLAERRR